MNNDHIFRTILIAGLILVVPVGIYHRLKAHKSGERLDRRQEGRLILFTLRPVALFRMISLVMYVIDFKLMQWSSMPMPVTLRWSGVVLGIFSGILLISTFRYLGSNLTDTVVTRTNHMLLTTGPYRFVRHPFYLAFTGVVIADSIVMANWFMGLTGGVCVVLLVLRTRIEEMKLIERFGDDYREYMMSTGRFFPRLR